MDIKFGITGILEDEVTVLYYIVPTELAEVNCCLLKLDVCFLCLCRQCECHCQQYEQYLFHSLFIFCKNTPFLFTLDALRCIGACGIAPAITINGKVYPKVAIADVPKIVEEYRKIGGAQ